MRNNVLLTLLAACLYFVGLTCHFVEYGVGFSLSLDYGVASIHYENGSTVDIAKIEAGPAYKQMMRATGAEVAWLNEEYRSSIQAAQGPLGLQSIRDYLPPWLGGNDTSTQILSRMLKALKTATESYLEAPLLDAEVAVPFPAPQAFFDTVHSACSSLSLYLPISALSPPGIYAGLALPLRKGCNSDIPPGTPDPEQLILTVDYTRAGLTALLIVEDCGIIEYRRVLHNTSLGTDRLDRKSGAGRGDLVRALGELTNLPLGHGNGAGLKQISELFLMGESALDQQLNDALKEVLREQFDSLVKTASDRGTGFDDPVFIASRAVALDCFERLQQLRYPHDNEAGCPIDEFDV
ncbi:MAG: hypothetical protein M4579_004474 [Chaenotheca gracillima]|nr:MAG: hypothetical protein M4579_004474 [Chaenotheca gracillima]